MRYILSLSLFFDACARCRVVDVRKRKSEALRGGYEEDGVYRSSIYIAIYALMLTVYLLQYSCQRICDEDKNSITATRTVIAIALSLVH